ncbi:MAG: ABC transporter ATP-binding protein [Syntrophorhabdales bacterium]|jgi:NitT/TauT family transport system ATP-binding protein/sulfonate transport system ATP-binding protein
MVEHGKTHAEAGSIVVDGVSKTYVDAFGGEIKALEAVHLVVRPGDFVAILGPSGCGKSTLLKLIAGLEPVTGGTISLDSEVISGPHYLRGMVFQDPTLYPWLTVRRNIALGLDACGIDWKSDHEVDEFVGLFGLNGFAHAYPHQLSGGMAQRVALARALINRPKVLLLDEPLGALDAFTRMQMQAEILRVWKTHDTTMLFVTHDIDEAIYLSDYIVIMSPRPGRIETTVPVTMGRPRERNLPDFLILRSKILEILHFARELTVDYYL